MLDSYLVILSFLIGGAGFAYGMVTHRKMRSQRRSLPAQPSSIKLAEGILEYLPFPVWLRDAELRVVYGNALYRKIIQGEGEAAWQDSYPNLDKQALTLARRALASSECETEERPIIIHGKRYYYQLTELPVTGASTFALMGFGWDHSIVEELRHALSQHISAHSDLLESSSSAMAIFGMDTKLRFYNQAFKQCWMLEGRWLDSHPNYRQFLDLLHEKRLLPEQANFLAFKNEQMDLFTNLLETRNEFWHLPDGRTMRVIAIPHALGGLLFAFEDLTDRLALERSHNTLIAVQTATLDNLHESVAVFSENGYLKLYNKLFLTLWRLDATFCAGQPHMNEVFEKTKKLFKSTHHWENYKNNTLAGIVKRQVMHDRLLVGDTIIERVIVPLPDGATLLSDLDVSDSIIVEQSLRERNEALEAVQRLKAQFLANISYELRTPLTSIVGLSEILDSQLYGALNENQRDYIESIIKASQQLTSMINDILDIASIEAGYFTLNIATIDILKTIDAVFALVRQEAEEKGVRLQLETTSVPVHLEADEQRIKQVLLKLLTNAIRASYENSDVVVKVNDTNPECVHISIADKGVGIAAEELPYLFDAFYRTKHSIDNNSPGVGLGLVLVKNLIECHGGGVEVLSELTKGTIVKFWLNRQV